jgi:predicted phage terminase large subunit-like protein
MNLPPVDSWAASCARDSMLDYISYIWPARDADPFHIGLHTRETCREIDAAILAYKSGVSTFIILTIPPRHGKSEIVSRMLPTRFLGMFPNQEVMVVSYAANLAETFSKDGRKIMRTSEYGRVFPRVSLALDNQGVQEWGVAVDSEPAKGKAQFSGMDGGNTGKGAALIVVDDPLKGREEAESALIRDKRWDTFRSDILTRRAPVSIVIVCLTRWHSDDIVGRIEKLQEKDPAFPKFKMLEWPATCEKYEWLFPERYEPGYYLAQKALIGSYAWASLYMCKPTPREGNILRADKVKILEPDKFDVMTAGQRFARGWDLASGEARIKENPDWTSGCKACVRYAKTAMPGVTMPVIFISDYVRGRWEALERNNRIVATAMGDGEIGLGVEAFGGYKDAYTTVKALLHGIRNVYKSQLPGDKIAKAEILAPIFEAGNVYMKRAPWNDAVLKQMADFPGGDHDDDVDSLGVAYDVLTKNRPTEWS